DVAQTDLPREPAVPVHDDRDVMGDRGLLDLMEEATLVRLVRGVADDFRDVRRHRRISHDWDRPIYPFAGTPPPEAWGGSEGFRDPVSSQRTKQFRAARPQRYLRTVLGCPPVPFIPSV